MPATTLAPARGALVERASTAMPGRIDGLTGLRFFFALLVVCHHSLLHWFGQSVYPITDFGYIGVDFFFVLSGFVLSWPSRELRRGRFWWDRVSRIWPLHLLGAVVALALVGAPGVKTLLANLLLVQAWSPDPHTYFSLNQLSWSLSVEVFFYLLFPWLRQGIAALSRRRRRGLAAGLVAAMLVYPGVYSLTIAPSSPGAHEWTTYVLPLWRLGEFGLGIVAALEVRRGWRPPVSGASALWLLVGCSAGLLAVGMRVGHLPNRPLVEIAGACLAALAFAAVAADESDGRRLWLARPTMVLLGASSYALYLCHGLLLNGLLRVGSFGGAFPLNAAAWLGYLAIAIGLSVVLHRAFELPCERWLRAHRPTVGR